MNKNISKILALRNEELGKNAQRAELLVRNDLFLSELQKVSQYIGSEFHRIEKVPDSKLEMASDDNILIELNYPKTKGTAAKELEKEIEILVNDVEKELNGYELWSPLSYAAGWIEMPQDTQLETVIFYKYYKLELYRELWERFCGKWNINPKWNANLRNFRKFQGPPVSMGVDFPYSFLFPLSALPIIIQIGPWTTLEDIRKVWVKIERIQKRRFYKEESSANFTRDICWYDLNTKLKMKPRQIAELWVKEFPKEIDILVMRRVKKQYKELSEENELELLDEINVDSSLHELKTQF